MALPVFQLGDPVNDPFYERMQKITYQFQNVRENGENPRDDGQHTSIPVPKPVKFEGLQAHRKRRKDQIYWHAPNPLGVGSWHARNQAKAARIAITKKVAPYGLSLVRTLGWGGNGIASLFLLGPTPKNPEPDPFVAKCNINPSDWSTALLDRERIAQEGFRGALHVVQTRDIGRFVTHTPQAPNPADRNQHPLKDILFLEYLALGSLHKVLCTVADHKVQTGTEKTIPDRVLWLIFHCLVQACIAMEHPPLKDWEFGHRIDADGKLDGNQPVSERVTPAHPAFPQAYVPSVWADEGASDMGIGFVHCDIDPQNILLGNRFRGPHATDHHNYLPVMKVSDFGSGKEVNAAVLSDRQQMWNLRTRSKLFFFTPEQFTEEWDTVAPSCPFYTFPTPETAGKYSYKTNLYQFALVMYIAITQTYPHMPPLHHKLFVPDPTDRAKKVRAWTYGAYLLNPKFQHTDKNLRKLVMQCLCDNPAYRPKLSDLKATIEAHLQNQDRNRSWDLKNNDAALMQWAHDNIFGPPVAAQQAAPTNWVDLP